MTTEPVVFYDDDTRIGSMIYGEHRTNFERALQPAEYAARIDYIKRLGGSVEEQIAYAGYLDFDKPSVAIAKMVELTPDVTADEWQRLISQRVAK